MIHLLYENVLYALNKSAKENKGVLSSNENDLKDIAGIYSQRINVNTLISFVEDEEKLKKAINKHYQSNLSSLNELYTTHNYPYLKQFIADFIWENYLYDFIKENTSEITKKNAKSLGFSQSYVGQRLFMEAYLFHLYKDIDKIFYEYGLSAPHFIAQILGKSKNLDLDEIIEKVAILQLERQENREKEILKLFNATQEDKNEITTIESNEKKNEVEFSLVGTGSIGDSKRSEKNQNSVRNDRKTQKKSITENVKVYGVYQDEIPDIQQIELIYKNEDIDKGVRFLSSNLKKLQSTTILKRCWKKAEKQSVDKILTPSWKFIQEAMDSVGCRSSGAIIAKWEKEFGYKAIIHLSHEVRRMPSIPANYMGIFVAKMQEFVGKKQTEKQRYIRNALR